ncbi:Glycosyl transferase family 1 [uncultured archaeon]|nr:Glycosyl transferase family 1 [uncultured archaeon]
MGHVFLSPLNWGLGHSTRDIPIIQELLNRGHEVTIGTSGNALALLKRECPECNFLLFKDYPAPYSASRFFLPKFVASIPILLRALARERKKLDQILSMNRFDLIISDNRMGVYSHKIPSYFITHQLRFSLPSYLYPFEMLTIPVNSFFHIKYDGVIVPDISPNGSSQNLSGKLCRSNLDVTNQRVYYAGILTSTKKISVEEDLDHLVIVSGPEPQRTKLEEIVLKQVQKLPGEKVVLLGSPQREIHKKLDGHTTVHSYVSTDDKVELMNRAQFVTARSGYTTMMEMAELDKKHGLFTPTPGQTEQEYLSRYYARQGWFLSRSQYRIRLPEDTVAAMQYKGFPEMAKTRENVARLYQDVLKQHLT